jgi:hypothetical protein
MDTQSNYKEPQKKDNRMLIYSILAGALVISWGYMFFSSRQAAETEDVLTNSNLEITSELTEVKDLYNEASFRLDSLMGINETLSETANNSSQEIIKLRAEISKILSNKKASDADLAKARTMIKQLNSKIEGLSGEVDRLTEVNQELTSENASIKKNKEEVESNLAKTESEKADLRKELESTKDVASTLKASNINIVALNEKNSGKEKETTNAKKADKLRINFTLDENRMAESGTKELFVVIIDPDGKTVTYNAGDAFIDRNGHRHPYTSKVSVNYSGGKSLPVSFDWKNDKTFTEGKYTIEIFHNGFKIGEEVRTLKKGGLFS